MPHRSPVRMNQEIRPVARKDAQRGRRRRLCKSGCRAAVCVIGGLMTTATPIRAFSQPLDPFVVDVLEGIRSDQAENGRVPSHAVLSGTLGGGESANVQLHTCAGIDYRALSLCDAGCTDFDLTAYDSSGEVLDSDVLPDGFPVLFFTPAASGMTTLSVEMVSCADSCDWGVQLFIDDGMAPGAPGAGDGGASPRASGWGRYVGTYRGPGGDTTVVRHESRLTVLFPSFQRESGGIGVLRPTGSTHIFRLESDGSSVDEDWVRFVVDGTGEVTALFYAGHESRRVK